MSDRWAREVVRSLQMARTASVILLALSGAALILGILASVATLTTWRQEVGGVSASDWLGLAQAAGQLISSLLPAGVLLGAAAFLRVYAIRYETDLLEDEPSGGTGPGAS